MKAKLNEYETSFALDIEAETLEEAIALARFGIGKLKRLDYCAVHFFNTGKAMASIAIGKSQANSTTL